MLLNVAVPPLIVKAGVPRMVRMLCAGVLGLAVGEDGLPPPPQPESAAIVTAPVQRNGFRTGRGRRS